MKSNIFKYLYSGSTLSRLSLLTALALAPCTSVLANPTGGVVSGGSASISSSGATLNINQSSDRAIIDWRGFDVGQDETAAFHQPTSASITLNRVNSTKASDIEGHLTANGNVVIINPNGILFGKNSTVDVNSLIATTADIDNTKFMNGSLTFDKAGNPSATIVNNGTITAKDAGLVGLVAPSVINNGVITAKLGRIQLSSGDTATVDLYGDNLMEVAVSDNVHTQLVSNTGTLRAEGGQIAMTAAAGRTIVDSLIDVQGEVDAPAIGTKNGAIYIYAAGSNAVDGNVSADKGIKSGASSVTVGGTLDASSYNTAGQGGTIAVLGDHVVVQDSALIDASGDAGGGTVMIGGETHGSGTTPTALMTRVDAGAIVRANAVTRGNGGTVTVWADSATDYNGTITAKGGSAGGNGGASEVSGRGWLNFNGSVDLTATLGDIGTLLLDPTDITISTGSQTAGTTFTSNTYTNTTTTPSVLNVSTLQTQLASSAVTVSTTSSLGGNGDITVANAVTWSSANTLTLNATRDVIFNASVTNTGTGAGGITALAGRNLTIANGVTLQTGTTGAMSLKAAGGSTTGTGLLTVGSTGLLNIGSGALTLLSGLDTSSNRTSNTFGTGNLTYENSVAGAMTFSGFQDLTFTQDLNRTAIYRSSILAI